MDVLLIPDIAYLILVVGLLLAILALFAPGTGVIELVAFFMLVLAGYGISQIKLINVWALVLLVVGVIPFILAVRFSKRLIYLVVALLALAIGSAYLFQSDQWWKPGVDLPLALVVSVLAGGFLWFVAYKALDAMARRPLNSLMDKVVGAAGIAKTDISREGSDYVAGENWSAHSAALIPAGTRVRVIAREGMIVEVEPFNKTV
jgi:membrane-bound ClpP family serine protease